MTAIPVSAFYDEPDAPRHYARFAFCKRPEGTLDEAIARLTLTSPPEAHRSDRPGP